MEVNFFKLSKNNRLGRVNRQIYFHQLQRLLATLQLRLIICRQKHDLCHEFLSLTRLVLSSQGNHARNCENGYGFKN
jgi:hypothetical protein